jgi:hypothetical protein
METRFAEETPDVGLVRGELEGLAKEGSAGGEVVFVDFDGAEDAEGFGGGGVDGEGVAGGVFGEEGVAGGVRGAGLVEEEIECTGRDA